MTLFWKYTNNIDDPVITLFTMALTHGMRKTAQMRMTLIWSSTVLVVADMCFVTVMPEHLDISQYLQMFIIIVCQLTRIVEDGDGEHVADGPAQQPVLAPVEDHREGVNSVLKSVEEKFKH